MIISSPEFEKLKKEVEKLRTEMSMLLLERDELRLVECKNIEMMYMLALGNLEYRFHELQCAVLRLLRKIDLIQAKKNRQEKVDEAAIERTLDEEFSEYRARLNEEIDKMNAALERSRGELLTEEETAELKMLYRAVVKALHPDLNPDISAAQLDLFRNAIVAYEHGDLHSLRLISTMVAEPMLPDRDASVMAMESLTEEKERLTELLRSLRDEIQKIKNEYPYTLKSIVQSEEKIAEKKAELENMIVQWNTVREAYQARIENMLR